MVGLWVCPEVLSARTLCCKCYVGRVCYECSNGSKDTGSKDGACTSALLLARVLPRPLLCCHPKGFGGCLAYTCGVPGVLWFTLCCTPGVSLGLDCFDWGSGVCDLDIARGCCWVWPFRSPTCCAHGLFIGPELIAPLQPSLHVWVPWLLCV